MKSVAGSELVAFLRHAERPVLVDFFATWCRPCRLMHRVLDDLAAEFEARIDMVRADLAECPEFARDLDIRTVPTLVLFARGRHLGTLVGVVPKSDVRAWLEEHIGPAS